MKPWWGWVWLGVVGLLLSLGLEITSVNHNPYAGSDQSVGLCRKSISIASFPTLLERARNGFRVVPVPSNRWLSPGRCQLQARWFHRGWTIEDPRGCVAGDLG